MVFVVIVEVALQGVDIRQQCHLYLGRARITVFELILLNDFRFCFTAVNAIFCCSKYALPCWHRKPRVLTVLMRHINYSLAASFRAIRHQSKTSRQENDLLQHIQISVPSHLLARTWSTCTGCPVSNSKYHLSAIVPMAMTLENWQSVTAVHPFLADPRSRAAAPRRAPESAAYGSAKRRRSALTCPPHPTCPALNLPPDCECRCSCCNERAQTHICPANCKSSAL